MGTLPIYWQSAAYALKHNEWDLYLASKNESIACRDAIEMAAKNNYRNGYVDSDAILDAVVPDYGYERVKLVLAATVREKVDDKCISNRNKVWAKTVRLPKDRDSEGCPRYSQYTMTLPQPCWTEAIVNKARRYLPPTCHCVIPGTGQLVIVKRYDNYYYPVGGPTKSYEDNQKIADILNAHFSITKAQAEAMLGGLLHGWNTPAANPRLYDCRGRTICSHPRREQGWER